MTNRFTKMVRTVTIRGVTTDEVAKVLVNHCVLSYDRPIDLISDKGRHLTYKFFQDECKTLNVLKTFKTTY